MLKSIHSSELQILCQLLREYRTAAGLTQVQLAVKLGWEQTHVSRCERGGRRLDILELRAWLAALDTPLAEFIERLEAQLAANTPPPHKSKAPLSKRR